MPTAAAGRPIGSRSDFILVLCADHGCSTRASSGPESQLTPGSGVPYRTGGIEPERGRL